MQPDFVLPHAQSKIFELPSRLGWVPESLTK